MTDQTLASMSEISAATEAREAAITAELERAIKDRDTLQKRIKALREEQAAATRTLRSIRGRKPRA